MPVTLSNMNDLLKCIYSDVPPDFSLPALYAKYRRFPGGRWRDSMLRFEIRRNLAGPFATMRWKGPKPRRDSRPTRMADDVVDLFGHSITDIEIELASRLQAAGLPHDTEAVYRALALSPRWREGYGDE